MNIDKLSQGARSFAKQIAAIVEGIKEFAPRYVKSPLGLPLLLLALVLIIGGVWTYKNIIVPEVSLWSAKTIDASKSTSPVTGEKLPCWIEEGQFVISPGATIVFTTSNGPLSVGNFTDHHERLWPSQITGLTGQDCSWGTTDAMFSILAGVPKPR